MASSMWYGSQKAWLKAMRGLTFWKAQKNLIADWTDAIKCGSYDTTTKSCKGAAK